MTVKQYEDIEESSPFRAKLSGWFVAEASYLAFRDRRVFSIVSSHSLQDSEEAYFYYNLLSIRTIYFLLLL